MTLTEFMLARIAEDEAVADQCEENPDCLVGPEHVTGIGRVMVVGRSRVLAECEAKRHIIEWHESWPVLVETQPEFTPTGADVQTMTFQMSQKIAWLTTQEYRARFGDEPPSSPMLRALAAVYSDHPDYRDEWRP